MTFPQEHPDRASERRERENDEQLTREQLRDLEERHAPRNSSPGEGAPRVSSAMVVLAWQVLHGCDHDRRDACKALAQEVLEVDEYS